MNKTNRWAMSQKCPVDGFKWVKIQCQFIKDHELHDLHNNLLFLPEWMNIEKVEKLASNLHDKKEYVMHIRILKQALLNHG